MEISEEIKQQLLASVAEHKKYQGLDALGYDGTTILALLATTAVTVIPADRDWVIVTKVLSALATFLIAMERALNLGARWRYHREMRHGYQALLTRVNLYRSVADSSEPDAVKRYLHEILSDLDALARREGQIPGSGQAPSSPSGPSS